MSIKNKLKSLDEFLDNNRIGKFINNSEWIRGKKGFYVGSAALIATSAVDVFATHMAISVGSGQELNPLADYVLENTGMIGLIGQKAIINNWVIGASYFSRLNVGFPPLAITNSIGAIYPVLTHYLSNIF